MTQVFAIIKKEIKDNIRDKRSFFFALIYGPVLMPALLVGPVITAVKINKINFEQTRSISVVGQEYAPNLIQHLRENNLEAVAAAENYMDLISSGDLKLVLEITEDYVDNLRAGVPAPLTIYYNKEDKDSEKVKRQVRIVLNRYDRQLSALRMRARGFDSRLLDTIRITEEDISDESISGKILGGIFPFLLVMSMMMGGFYLAVDSTAGERERHSLEPLLSLPVSRKKLVLGKYLATFVFVFFSGLLASINIFLVFKFVQLSDLGIPLSFEGLSVIKAFLVALPLSVLITSFLVAVAAFAKSTKEAQTHLGIAMMFPMIPFLLLQFINIKTTALVMLIPFVSQFKILEKVLGEKPVAIEHLSYSVASSLVLAILLLLFTTWLYCRDRMLD